MAIQPESYERRASMRVKSQLPAQFKAGGISGQTVTADISEGGLFLLTDEDPPLGERTHVHLELGTVEPVRIIGEVVRKAAMPALGVAVRFNGMTLDDRARLTKWIQQEISATVTAPARPSAIKRAQPALVEEPLRTPLDPDPAEPVVLEPPVLVSDPSYVATAVAVALLLARTLLYVGLPLLALLLIGLGIGKFIDSLRIAI